MRKILVLVVVALAVAMVAPTVAGADVNGPACTDIIGGGGAYGATGQVNLTLQLAAPACRAFSYTYFVETTEGVQELAPAATSDDGLTLFYQTEVNPATNETICVYATSSVGGGKHVFDRAPDSGCVSIAPASAPGFVGFG